MFAPIQAHPEDDHQPPVKETSTSGSLVVFKKIIHSFMHLLNKYLQGIHCVPSTGLIFRGTEMNKACLVLGTPSPFRGRELKK